MQEVYYDGSKGGVKTADTLEELVPEIKKSLKNPKVAYVTLCIPQKRGKRKR